MSRHVSYYAYGKFSEARSYMARSPKPLRKRVASAYLGWLFILREDDLSDEMQSDFAELRALVTEKPSSNWRGAVEETLESMHWRRVRKCADLIVNLASKADYSIDPKFDYRRAT